MSKQSKRSRNPVYQSGYEKGFEDGKVALVDRISDRLSELKDQPGIGPATWGKIANAISGVKEEAK